MSHIRPSRAGRIAHCPTSPHAFVAIAEDAVAMGDYKTAIRFIEAVYQVFDEVFDAPSFETAA
jgi:hypothetical protein